MPQSPFPALDRVRTETDERLDRPDFEGVLALADEGSQRQLGALLGYGGGVTSPPKVTLDLSSGTKTMSLGPFQYYVCAPGWRDADGTQKGWFGAFATFDPSSGSTSQFAGNFNAVYQAAVSSPTSAAALSVLYVRPRTIDTDLDARRKFIGAADTPVSIKTRSRITHEFQWAAVAPDHASVVGWAPVLAITGWSGAPGTPSMKYASFLDNPQIESKNYEGPYSGVAQWLSAGQSVSPLLAVLDGPTAPTPLPTTSPTYEVFRDDQTGLLRTHDFGLLQLFGLLRYKLASLLDSTSVVPWYQNPVGTDGTTRKGMKQLIDESLSAIVLSGDVLWDGSAYSTPVAGLPSGWSITVSRIPSGVGNKPCAMLTIVPPSGTGTYAIQAVTANPHYMPSPVADLFIRLAMVDTSSAPPSYTAFVYQFATDNASVDGSFQFSLTLRKV